MPNVQYWSFGNQSQVSLPFTQDQIVDALVADWLPGLPVPASNILGWPYHLLEIDPNGYLSIRTRAGRSDRQWKSVLSWMLGIAGTRRVLSEEAYIYIAPCSAFYPERKRPVDITPWHQDYPPSVLEIICDPNNDSHLRPDYIAIRQSSTGLVEFALVESKGISSSLVFKHICPHPWTRQVRNAIVKANGSPVVIPRHIVVATRCNPNGIRGRSRWLQIRSWNSKIQSIPNAQDILLDVISTHYAGLCRNLGLWKNLRALQLATEVRRTENVKSNFHLSQVAQEVDNELKERGRWQDYGDGSANFSLETDLGAIYVQVTKLALSIIRAIRSGFPRDEVKGVIARDTFELANWYSDMAAHYKHEERIAINRSGFVVKTGEIRLPGPV